MARTTRQRTAIQQAFETAQRPLAPSEVLKLASKLVPSMSLSTVYRTLRRMEEEGMIAPVSVPGEPPRYELAHVAEHHHHHFHCNRCGRVFDLVGCPTGLSRLVPRGFVLEEHTLVLHGLCAECAPA
ncbi:MAG: transcriptional repressor [Planctomycetota bacterium]|nr:MAG: transcriptional repressor [Planctomycetota bacterium]